MKYLIYFIYQAEGRIEDYVPVFLNSVRGYFDVIHVIFNGTIAPGEAAKLPMADRIQERDNDEFDVGAYKAAIFSNPDEYWQGVDELTLANFTFFAPLGEMQTVFDWAEAQKVDFWGLSAHKQMIPNPFTGNGILPYHINSHWISVRKPILQSPDFLAYWRNLAPIRSYIDSVLIHESQFTEHFTEKGYSRALYMKDEEYPSDYPAFNDIAQAVEDGFPIIKRRLFYHTPTTYMDRYDVNVRRALDFAAEGNLYDLDLVWDSVAGTVDPAVLYENADLLHVVPDASLPVALTDAALQPARMILLVSGSLDARSVAQAAARIGFPCRLDLVGDSPRSLAALSDALAGRQVSITTHGIDDLAEAFGTVEALARAAEGEVVLFASLTAGALSQFDYGMRQVARDPVVAASARSKLIDNRFFGLALPAIRTYGTEAETEHLDDAARNEAQIDLAGFNVKPKLDGQVLFSTAGVFWIRADLLADTAGEILRHVSGQPIFRDTGHLEAKRAAAVSDGKEIDTFLSIGLPFFAAERRYITIALSNTAELPRNFIKMESRYRVLSERIGLRDPFLLKNRIEYLLQFNTQEERQVIWGEILNQGVNDAWSRAFEKGRERGRAEARSSAKAGPSEEVRRSIHQAAYREGWVAARRKAAEEQASAAPAPMALTEEVRREIFDAGYKDGWTSASSHSESDHRTTFDAGFNEGWKQALEQAGGLRSGVRSAWGRIINRGDKS